MKWIRRTPRTKLDELTELWHLQGSASRQVAVAVAGLESGACGSTLGTEVDRRDDEPDSGDRCPVCQGIHTGGREGAGLSA